MFQVEARRARSDLRSGARAFARPLRLAHERERARDTQKRRGGDGERDEATLANAAHEPNHQTRGEREERRRETSDARARTKSQHEVVAARGQVHRDAFLIRDDDADVRAPTGMPILIHDDARVFRGFDVQRNFVRRPMPSLDGARARVREELFVRQVPAERGRLRDLIIVEARERAAIDSGVVRGEPAIAARLRELAMLGLDGRRHQRATALPRPIVVDEHAVVDADERRRERDDERLPMFFSSERFEATEAARGEHRVNERERNEKTLGRAEHRVRRDGPQKRITGRRRRVTRREPQVEGRRAEQPHAASLDRRHHRERQDEHTDEKISAKGDARSEEELRDRPRRVAVGRAEHARRRGERLRDGPQANGGDAGADQCGQRAERRDAHEAHAIATMTHDRFGELPQTDEERVRRGVRSAEARHESDGRAREQRAFLIIV